VFVLAREWRPSRHELLNSDVEGHTVDRDMVSPPSPKVNGVGRRSYRRRDGRPVGGGKFRVRIAA
jgi:hypothetical protein